MKNFYLTAFFLFLFSCSLFAQNGNSQCPLIIVTAPNLPAQPGETLTFSSSIQGEGKTNLRYKWTTDKGTIIEGQGTKMIHISTEGLSETVITATFEVQGLPKDCNNKDSDAGVVAPNIISEPYDSYGKIFWEDESIRFDSFLLAVQQNSGYKGYIWITTAKNESIINIKKYIGKLVRHIKFRKISPDKFIFAIEKSSDRRTTLLTFQSGAKLPKCEGCEIIIGSDLK